MHFGDPEDGVERGEIVDELGGGGGGGGGWRECKEGRYGEGRDEKVTVRTKLWWSVGDPRKEGRLNWEGFSEIFLGILSRFKRFIYFNIHYERCQPWVLTEQQCSLSMPNLGIRRQHEKKVFE